MTDFYVSYSKLMSVAVFSILTKNLYSNSTCSIQTYSQGKGPGNKVVFHKYWPNMAKHGPFHTQEGYTSRLYFEPVTVQLIY